MWVMMSVTKACPRVLRQALAVAKFYLAARQKIAPAQPLGGVDGEAGMQLPRRVNVKRYDLWSQGLVPLLNTYMEAVFRPRTQRVPTLRAKALWDRTGRGRKTNKGLAQTSRDSLPARRKVDAASFPCFVLPPYDSGWAGRAKKHLELMVPVNGTRRVVFVERDASLWRSGERITAQMITHCCSVLGGSSDRPGGEGNPRSWSGRGRVRRVHMTGYMLSNNAGLKRRRRKNVGWTARSCHSLSGLYHEFVQRGGHPPARIPLKLCEREEWAKLPCVLPELPSSWPSRRSYRASILAVLRHRSVRSGPTFMSSAEEARKPAFAVLPPRR
ncbi:hypothetical protein BJV78DRAFT_1152340 [Lactifluus subvellereus]|nr:hypothetical protein BJV78DRAFT_1152340 [Lactifluus subvellereus]